MSPDRTIGVLDIGESGLRPAHVWRDCVRLCRSNGVRVVSLPRVPTIESVENAVADLAGVDTVLVLAAPDPNVRIACGIVHRLLGAEPLRGIDMLLDKYRTRQVCDRHGIPQARAVAGAGEQILAEAETLLKDAGSVLVKDPHGWLGMGVLRVDTVDGLRRAIVGLDRTVVEEFIDGEEYSVELISTDKGVTCLGWVAKGSTNSAAHPVMRLRYAPAAAVPEVLRRPCVALIQATGYRGIAEVELIVRDGAAYLTECNPRTSGVTSVLSFGNRVSSPQWLVGEHIRAAPARPRVVEAVVEIAVPSEADFRARPPRSNAYLHPTADSGHEPRAFLWGAAEPLLSDVSGISPALGRTLASRLRVVEGLC